MGLLPEHQTFKDSSCNNKDSTSRSPRQTKLPFMQYRELQLAYYFLKPSKNTIIPPTHRFCLCPPYEGLCCLLGSFCAQFQIVFSRDFVPTQNHVFTPEMLCQNQDRVLTFQVLCPPNDFVLYSQMFLPTSRLCAHQDSILWADHRHRDLSF